MMRLVSPADGRVRDVLSRAGEGWLKNTEVCDLLVHYRTYGLPICRHPPNKPAGVLFQQVACKILI